MKTSPRTYDLEDRLVAFAVFVCRLIEALPRNRIGNHVSSQLLRSSTAAAPNYGEAQSAESRKDFVHKMKVSLKELRETRVWLKFAASMGLAEPSKVAAGLDEAEQLIRIFFKSISTAGQGQGKS